MDEICREDVQFVILGTGDAKYENMFRYLHGNTLTEYLQIFSYSNERSHKVYAACDSFLMRRCLSRCGLSQLISLRYGTVPIVRETGGLKDTVEAYNEYECTAQASASAIIMPMRCSASLTMPKMFTITGDVNGIRSLTEVWPKIFHGTIRQENTKISTECYKYEGWHTWRQPFLRSFRRCFLIPWISGSAIRE